METPENNPETILQRKKKAVKIGKVETLLILRSYLTHPTKWADILENIRQNDDQLPVNARQLYFSSTNWQLRDRMSGKLTKLMADEAIADADIRDAVQQIKQQEMRLVRRLPINDAAPDPASHGRDARDDIVDRCLNRNPMMEFLSLQWPSVYRLPRWPRLPLWPRLSQWPRLPPLANAGHRRRKRPLADIIRSNQLAVEKFINKKIPKLMRQLGGSSSDESN